MFRRRKATSRVLSFSLIRWPGTPPRSKPPWPASITMVDAAGALMEQARTAAPAIIVTLNRFMRNGGGNSIVRRRVWRSGRKLRCGVLRIASGLIDHASMDSDRPVSDAAQVGLRFHLHKRRLLQQFAVQAHMRVGPGPRRSAVQHVELIHSIDLG